MGHVSQVLGPALLVNPLRKLLLVPGSAERSGGRSCAEMTPQWLGLGSKREHEELELGILR